MTTVFQYVASTERTIRGVLGNGRLLLLLGALAISGVSGWAYSVALQVFAFHAGGKAAVGLVVVLVMVPAGIAAPFAAVLADRFRRERVLWWSSLFRAGVLGAIAGFMLFGGPAPVIYVLAVVASMAARVFYPAQAALLPSLARHPDELIAANSLTTGIENGALLVGPALGGVLVALTSTGATVAVSAGALLIAALALSGLRVAGARPTRSGGISARELLAGLRAIVRRPALRRPVGLYGVVMLGEGMLGVLIVVLAFSLLDIGQGGVGYLNAALGAGSLVGAGAGLAFARLRQGPMLATAVVTWGASLGLIAAWPRTTTALVLLTLAGAVITVLDISCVTILQRVTAEDVRGRVFGVLEGVLVAAVGVGAALAPPLDDLLGTRVLLLSTGATVGAVGLVLALRVGDAADAERERRTRLLRAYPAAARLTGPVLEGVAASLVPLTASAGEAIVRQGEIGDRFYLLADGTTQVVSDGKLVATLRRGDWFGERALLSAGTHTATVTATGDAELYALDRETFLQNLRGFAAAPAAPVRPGG